MFCSSIAMHLLLLYEGYFIGGIKSLLFGNINFKDSNASICKCLEHGIVPSAITINGNLPHPTAIINSAVLFMLSGKEFIIMLYKKSLSVISGALIISSCGARDVAAAYNRAPELFRKKGGLNEFCK